MDRPFAYVCSPFRGDMEANTQKAREYCREVYEAGYSPLAPHLLMPQFLDEHNPAEREAGIRMGEELLTGCQVLVVCGDTMTEGMHRELMLAQELGIEDYNLINLPTAAMRESAFSVYIANKTSFDENGDYAGAWHNFPTTPEAFQATLEKIGAAGSGQPGYFVTEYRSEMKPLQHFLPEDANVDELNYLAAMLKSLDTSAKDTFRGAMATGQYHSIHDMLNVLENLDRFRLHPFGSVEVYGKYLAGMLKEEYSEIIGAMRESSDLDDQDFAQYINTLETYFDSEKYGRDVAEMECGIFTSYGYVFTISANLQTKYKGLEDIPQECRISQLPETQSQRETVKPSIREQLAAARDQSSSQPSRSPSQKPHDPEL